MSGAIFVHMELLVFEKENEIGDFRMGWIVLIVVLILLSRFEKRLTGLYNLGIWIGGSYFCYLMHPIAGVIAFLCLGHSLVGE